MKKIVYVLFLIILLTGCGEKEEVNNITYDNTYYQVATPYKETIGSYSLSSYDKNEVDLMLMNLSTNYFKTNNSLYQAGQYLDSSEIKTLVNKYNETESIKVDKIDINPKYITTIYEQNYLTMNNNLKGISLALVVTNKQYYSETSYKIIDEKIVLDYAKEKANELVKYMYSKEELKDVKIIIGIYLESNNTLNGSFKYIGSANKEKVELQYVNYNYQSLDSNYVMTNDSDTYNNILAIKQSLNEFNNVYINPIGLYKDKQLVLVNLTINKSYFKNSEILTITNILTNNLNTFDSNIGINIYFKSNNNIKAFISKKDNKLETHILEE